MAQNWRTLNNQICSRENHSGNAVFNIKTSLATPGLQAKDQNRKISITFCYGTLPHLISHVLGKLLSDRKCPMALGSQPKIMPTSCALPESSFHRL
jgi:hypothetical protein